MADAQDGSVLSRVLRGGRREDEPFALSRLRGALVWSSCEFRLSGPAAVGRWAQRSRIFFSMAQAYTEASIKTLSSLEHIRLRPGMYIGRLGNGAHAEDGIYVLLKETIDNSIDEFTMGFGRKIEVELTENRLRVRDYGRGIPLGKLIDCVSIINTGAKYDSETFQKSVGLNGVGQKAVNALAIEYRAQAFRDGQTKLVEFEKGRLKKDHKVTKTEERNGTLIEFVPDDALFGKDFRFRAEFIEDMLWNYAFLNRGLTLTFNGKVFKSEHGLRDLLTKNLSGEPLYPIIHLEGDDIEVAFTHGAHYGEEYYSFVNGQHTTMGGTHLTAFREALVDTVRNFFKKDYDAADIRQAIDAAVAVRVMEPVFESQTKTKLGSTNVGPDGPSLKDFVGKFMQQALDAHLHKNRETTEVLKNKIEENERERKELAGIRSLARERAKKASLHNRKLRDCRVHLGDRSPRNEETTLFIVEGDSAAGSLTATRDVQTQAVFALKGKPLNTYGLSKKVIYENEEFHLLQSALNVEESLDGLRYNKVVIATDADVDGMHIRLLLISFFLQYFPDLIRNGHLYILETPLFRVRNKKRTMYCYSEAEKQAAIAELGASHEITRFKGLGEISASEFKDFIGENIRLEPVTLAHLHNSDELLGFFMGKNTPERQEFIIDNLRIEKDLVAVTA
jgi:topoisomerase-4 subunit B